MLHPITSPTNASALVVARNRPDDMTGCYSEIKRFLASLHSDDLRVVAVR